MSIIDSQTERLEAELKIGAKSHEELVRDLEYWTLAAHEQSHEFSDLQDRMNTARSLYAEASTWTAMIADELVKRRREKAGS